SAAIAATLPSSHMTHRIRARSVGFDDGVSGSVRVSVRSTRWLAEIAGVESLKDSAWTVLRKPPTETPSCIGDATIKGGSAQTHATAAISTQCLMAAERALIPK